MKKITILSSWMVLCSVWLSAQKVGVNTITPLATFHVELGSNISNGVLFTGLPSNETDFPSLGAGNRFMFYPSRGAIRAGIVGGTHWDNFKVGVSSAAFGSNTIARTAASFASNYVTTAGGFASSAFGSYTITKGYSSMVIGMYNDSLIAGLDEFIQTEATPLFMIGNGNDPETRNNAMAVFKNGNLLMKNPTAVLSLPASFELPTNGPGTRLMWIPHKSAFRAGTTDSGHWDEANIGTWSFAGGLNTIANQSYSFAMGAGTSSKGLASTALGWFTTTTGDISTSIGFKTRAKSYASVAIGRWNDSISISNNTTWIHTDPLFMIGNGSAEAARNNAMVVYKNGNMILKNPSAFYYTKLVDYSIPVSGEGTRLMWLPEISAFRVGTVSGTDWDLDNTGPASFATGINNRASGTISMATGIGNISRGYSSLAIGTYNDPILTMDEGGGNEPASPLFIIGNGDDEETRHNAMVVRKDGFVGIGTDTPANKLSVDGNANFTGTATVGTNTPNPSAQLDVTSTTKGFLPPRMTYADRNGIVTPAIGLVVFCTNCTVHGQLQIYNGFIWANMTGGTAAGPPVIGEAGGGGKVAYIFQPGDPGYVAGETHGLIAALSDQGAGYAWACMTNVPGADGTALGTGNQNTLDIIAHCSIGDNAAGWCYLYASSGYTDWYLPGKDELNKLYLNKIAIGNFGNALYWSSSEVGSTNAWTQYFVDGTQNFLSKTSLINFRAVRTF